jgi:hypothetical protein
MVIFGEVTSLYKIHKTAMFEPSSVSYSRSMDVHHFDDRRVTIQATPFHALAQPHSRDHPDLAENSAAIKHYIAKYSFPIGIP